MGTIRSKTGQVVSTDNAQGSQRVDIGAVGADYDWGVVAATLGQRPKIIVFAANGDSLVLPAENLCAGWEIFVDNNGAGVLDVEDDTLTTILAAGTIAIGATAHVYCDGIAWYDLGEAAAL